MSVCTRASLTERIFVQFDRGLVRKCQETSNLPKIGGEGERKNNGHFTQRLVFIIDSNKSSAAIHRTQCCASILMLSTFITLMTAIYIHIHYIHQYKREVFLLDHINNGYTNASQNYFLYTFPISLP